MASPELPGDALLCLRQAIASDTPFVTTKSSEPATASSIDTNLAFATHVQFSHGSKPLVFPLASQTRFESSVTKTPVDLRSIILAWQRKDDTVPEYLAACRKLNEDLSSENAAGGTIQNLIFAEKLDLITWLEGASQESDFMKPLDPELAKQQAEEAAGIAAGRDGQAQGRGDTDGARRDGKTIDPRLREIYNGERRMGDRNTVLRGIKPTDFSHVRKHAEAYLGRGRKQQGRPAQLATGTTTTTTTPMTPNPALVQNRTKPNRRPEPIILLSPSASSLLRMSNIKSFLDGGVYTPPDSASTNVNILHVSRLLPSIDSQRPLRFILVDTPEQFKPDYWSRVVAVFTTGQTWQFKSYKWQSPPDLFSHALGIFVGWRNEDIPQTVKGWGRGVISVQIDPYNPHQGPTARWRDREVVEGIWTAIEESMRSRGWSKDGITSTK